MRLSKLEYFSLSGKGNFSGIHPTHISIYSYLVQRFCKLSERIALTLKYNN